MKRECIDGCVDTKCLSVTSHGSDVAVTLACPERSRTVIGSHLLLAVGRRPNTVDIGLEKADIAVDSRGYKEMDDIAIIVSKRGGKTSILGA